MNLNSILLGFLLLASSVPALAQGGGGRGGRNMSEEDYLARIERMADTLDLSADQEKKIMDFEKKMYQTMQKERENFNPETGDREAMRARMTELREEREAFYKKTLNKEQYAQYEEMAEARRAQMQQRRSQGSGSEGERGRGRGRSGGGGGGN
jgi:hypothetical protein